jgi:hypothetical protein
MSNLFSGLNRAAKTILLSLFLAGSAIAAEGGEWHSSCVGWKAKQDIEKLHFLLGWLTAVRTADALVLWSSPPTRGETI